MLSIDSLSAVFHCQLPPCNVCQLANFASYSISHLLFVSRRVLITTALRVLSYCVMLCIFKVYIPVLWSKYEHYGSSKLQSCPRYTVVLSVQETKLHYKRGALYSMWALQHLSPGELAINMLHHECNRSAKKNVINWLCVSAFWGFQIIGWLCLSYFIIRNKLWITIYS